jgi:hypothetical protein
LGHLGHKKRKEERARKEGKEKERREKKKEMKRKKKETLKSVFPVPIHVSDGFMSVLEGDCYCARVQPKTLPRHIHT